MRNFGTLTKTSLLGIENLIYMEASLTRDMWFDVNRDEYFNHLLTCNTLNKLKDGIKRKEI